MGKLFRVLFTKGPSFGKSQLLHGVKLANQNKNKKGGKIQIQNLPSHIAAASDNLVVIEKPTTT